MKNKGFTLIEMLAVIGVISLMLLIAVPSIMDQIANKRDEISDTTKNIIYTGTDLYLNNNITTYPKISGEVYCIKLEKLTETGYLKAPLKDASSNTEINLNRYIKITVNNYKEYDYTESTGNGLLKLNENCE